MTSEEKIWQILQIIDSARKLAPSGRLSQYDARKIDPVVSRDDHEQIFTKLAEDKNVIDLHDRPDYQTNFHYRFYVLPGFENVYNEYKAIDQQRAKAVKIKEYDRQLEELRRAQSRPNIFDLGYNQHLIRKDPDQERDRENIQRLAIEASDRRLQRDLEEKRHRESLQLQRMLASKGEDRRVHAINLIIERVENIQGELKNISIAFLDFNFGSTNDNFIYLFRPFLEKLQKEGCFDRFDRGHAGPAQANISFVGINVDKLIKYRDELLAEQSKLSPSHQIVNNTAVMKALHAPNSEAPSQSRKRRVSYDKQNGNLFLDGNRIYTASLTGPEYHFLSFLWDNWERQLPYQDIYKYVRGKMGKEVADVAKNFCAKMKNNVKQKCAIIDEIITIPTRTFFMMADPVTPEIAGRDIIRWRK